VPRELQGGGPVIEGMSGDGRARVIRAILAGVVLFEAVLLVGYGAYLAVEAVIGGPTEPLAVGVMAAFVMLLGVGLMVCSRGAFRGSRGVRAPILVWAILQAAVGAQALQARWYASVLLVLTAVASIFGVLWPGVLQDDTMPE
jgi:hypothetical protein